MYFAYSQSDFKNLPYVFGKPIISIISALQVQFSGIQRQIIISGIKTLQCGTENIVKYLLLKEIIVKIEFVFYSVIADLYLKAMI